MARLVSGFLISVLFLLNGAFGASEPQDSSSTFKVLYNFTGGADGCCIYGGVARDHDGNLYGVAYADDNLTGYGTLFKLTRDSRGYAFQVLLLLSAFTGRECMTTPILDKWGNLIGVCKAGGRDDDGTLWELSSSGVFTVLHQFYGPSDGMSPQDSVVLDAAGEIYGTAYTYGAADSGTLWKFSRDSRTFTVLHAFSDGNDGGILSSGPSIDEHGVLWGTTDFGPNCYYCANGTAWSYDPASGTFATITDFNNTGIVSPQSKLAIDRQGNLFGTAFGTAGGRNQLRRSL